MVDRSLVRIVAFLSAMTCLFLVSAAQSQGNAIRRLPGFEQNTLEEPEPSNANPISIEATVGPIDLGFSLDFLGKSRNQVFVNSNGNLTFDDRLMDFQPFPMATTNREIIAPFFADVDTSGGRGTISYGTDNVGGNAAFAATWTDAGYWFQQVDKRNSFQVVLIDRADTGVGNFDIEFNFDQIQWETGQTEGSPVPTGNGLGGLSARVGYSNGSGEPETHFEIQGSGVNGALLDDNAVTGLVNTSLNSEVLGRHVLPIRNGGVQAMDINQGVSGAWYDSGTPGQGFLFDVEPVDQFLFVAWFTYTDPSSKVGSPEHRWLTAQGDYSGGQAELQLFSTSGGQFATVTETSTEAIGTLSVTLVDCDSMTVSYDIPDDGLSGTINLVRLLPQGSELCRDLSAP